MSMFDDSILSLIRRKLRAIFIKEVAISDHELEALKRENREAGRAAPGALDSTSGGNNEAKMSFKPFIYGGDLDD
ncbi:MAG: hypothetical protein EBW17_00020 [Actinobacteria bacterium]|jgi:hypothetical protein|nr:hypothetical protein [Actinomycetales bacterium]NCV41557.1 hypothetical protein [Actinomycetota bacterium]